MAYEYEERQALAEPMDWDYPLPAIHEWRHYITDGLREMWLTFTPEQRLAIMRMAAERAAAEEWD